MYEANSDSADSTLAICRTVFFWSLVTLVSVTESLQAEAACL